MAWEKRQRGGTYYTRSRREGGRVVREYLGSGEAGELFADIHDSEREEARITRAIEQAERDELSALDAELAVLDVLADAALRQALEAAGYHQHKRGEWRKKRNDGTQQERHIE